METPSQPRKPVVPSMKDCIARMMSGEASMMSSFTAPSTTPTTTPASSRRKVCCRPRASSRVSTTAAKAPTKAAPVRPMRTPQAVAAGDRPNRASTTATPSEAPEALPSK